MELLERGTDLARTLVTELLRGLELGGGTPWVVASVVIVGAVVVHAGKGAVR